MRMFLIKISRSMSTSEKIETSGFENRSGFGTRKREGGRLIKGWCGARIKGGRG